MLCNIAKKIISCAASIAIIFCFSSLSPAIALTDKNQSSVSTVQKTVKKQGWTETKIKKRKMFTTQACNKRQKAILGATPICTVKFRKKVTVVAKTNTGYYKIKNGGYIHKDYLSKKRLKHRWAEAKIKPKKMYIKTTCNKRKKAIEGSTPISKVRRGKRVTVVAKTNTNYYKVMPSGYINEIFLSSKKISDKTEPANSTYDTSAAKILNSADLKPKKSGNAALDKKINKIFNRIHTEDMDTYQKVKACYDYLIENVSYGSVDYPTSGFGNIYPQGCKNYIAWAASSCLDKKVATCNRYSAAFIAMVRRIGLTAKYIDGYTHAAAGGYLGHVWVEVKINGVTYVFDPQVEDNMTSGEIQYLRFCKTYSQLPGKYKK